MLMIKISIVKIVESDTDSMGYTTKFTQIYYPELSLLI